MTPQHMQALAVANERRIARATIKRELRTCHSKQAALALVADHIENPVDVLHGCTAFDLIGAGFRCGHGTALNALNAARIGANVKIGAPGLTQTGYLTEAQREKLCAILRDPTGAPRRYPRPTARPAPSMAPERERVVVPAAEPQGAERPSLARWCAVCAQYALPMHDGTCGFCDNHIADEAA